MPQPKSSVSYGEKMFILLRDATLTSQIITFPGDAYTDPPGKPPGSAAKAKAHAFIHRVHGLRRALCTEGHPMADQFMAVRVRNPTQPPGTTDWVVRMERGDADFDGMIVQQEGDTNPAPEPQHTPENKQTAEDAIFSALDDEI